MEKAKEWYRDNSFLFEKEDDDGDTFLPNRSIEKLIEIAYLEGILKVLVDTGVGGMAAERETHEKLKELLDE